MFQFYLYGKALANLLGGESAGESSAVDYLSDTIKMALTTSAYTPDLDAHEFFSDVTNEITGTGYTAGGVALGSKTITYTAANSWATAAATTTAYAVGDIVRPAAGNGHLYRCIVAGTSGGSAPTWPTVSGQTVADGTVTWAEIGRGLLVIDCADPQWTSATFTARQAVIYKDTGTPATSPLLATGDFGSDTSVTSSTFQVTLPATGWWNHATP
ncbi:MAG: hypothetical protein AB7Q16_05890 [Vicinamibacterales bacterium]